MQFSMLNVLWKANLIIKPASDRFECIEMPEVGVHNVV